MKASIRTLALVAGIAVVLPAGAHAQNLRMMTGPQGGAWIPIGGQLKDIWERAVPGTNVQVLPGAGIANVRGVQEGKADIGFGNSISTVDGIAGREPFKAPQENVCNLATLYPQYYQLVVHAEAGIKTVADLKGKALSTQPRGNTGEAITAQLLQVNGLSYKDVRTSFVSYTDSVNQLKDGHAQAFGLGTTIPAASVMDIAAARDITLLDLSSSLEGMRKLNPGYTLLTVPANTYAKQEGDVQVIGYATHLVVSCKLSEDAVYAMAKSMSENIPTLANIVAAMKGLDVKGMAEDIGVPFHPGAARFYKEAGIEVKTN